MPGSDAESSTDLALGVKIAGVSDPTDPDRELLEGGALLPGPGATLAGPTFEEWLLSGG